MTTAVRRAALLLAALVTTACKGVEDLAAVSRAVAAEYKYPARITLRNGHALVVTFRNAPFAGLPDEPRGQLAREVAGFARAHYADSAAVDTVGVVFERVRGAGPVTLREQRGRYTFGASELAAPGAAVTVERR